MTTKKHHELHPGYHQGMLEDLAHILHVAVDEVPEVFKLPRPKALKIGIGADLASRYGKIDSKALSQWFYRWTNTRQYLARVAFSLHRHDLDGNDFDRITDADRSAAKVKLQQRRERFLRRKAA